MERLTETLTARVVCAAALTDSQISALKKILAKKTGKRVDISPSIDPSVIGGLSIYVDGRVIDYTIKKQLRDLKDSLKRRSAYDSKA